MSRARTIRQEQLEEQEWNRVAASFRQLQLVRQACCLPLAGQASSVPNVLPNVSPHVLGASLRQNSRSLAEVAFPQSSLTFTYPLALHRIPEYERDRMNFSQLEEL